MFDDECETTVIDPRGEAMREWIDLDNKIKSIELQQAEAGAKLADLRPKRTKLGQKIAEIVYPSDKPMQVDAAGGDW